MIYTKLLLFFTLIAYSFIVAQSFMYIIALRDVQNGMGAGSYIELRKRMDNSFRANFKFAVYAALVFNLFLVICTAKHPGSLLFISSLIAFIALITDNLLTVKGNLPINALINTWTVQSHPGNWETYRAKWLQVFQYRQIANISGFICLLAGTIFRLC